MNEELLTSNDVAKEALRLSELLREAHRHTLHMAREAANAEYEFNRTWARARIEAEGLDGTAEFKKAFAVRETAERKQASTLNEALHRSARDAEVNLRAQISVLQTVHAGIRIETELAR